MTLGRLIARVAIGGLFAGHGTQKLFGWFGGPGVAGASQMMRKLELHPPRRNALAAGAAETTAGVLLALGAALHDRAVDLPFLAPAGGGTAGSPAGIP